jgi:hypothetical protein
MTRVIVPTLLFLALMCIFRQPGTTAAQEQGPYIDSIGFRAAQARIETVDLAEESALIANALYVPKTAAEQKNQPEFFQSLEESYQRYIPLFTLDKKSSPPGIKCSFNLLETFTLRIFDPQPFLNAMLHSMALDELSTLDFALAPQGNDSLLVKVSWAKPQSGEMKKEFAITEGELTLAVTKHRAVLITPRP